MKIGIVTVNEVFNCGSFLQSYALNKTLTKLCECKVVFLKNKYPASIKLWYRSLQSLKLFCTGKVHLAKHVLCVYFNFKKAHKKMKIQRTSNGIDLMIYGSDTIWNMNDPYFNEQWKRYWGCDFTGRKVSYAASIDSTPDDALLCRKELCEALDAFDKISVRDISTENFVKKAVLSERDIYRVVDPTMLLDADEYKRMAPHIDQSGFIFFYYFGSVPLNIKKQTIEFAQKTGRKIIAMGSGCDFADKTVCNDPFLMLSYYMNADFVVTNTFHGNIFSLIFNKQFISLGKNKKKVRNLLDEFGQLDRLIDEGTDIESLFNSNIDFDESNRILSISKERSLSYLRDIIAGVEEK